MNYFRKTKFRESSLVIVLLVIGVIYFTSRDTPAKEEIDIQALIDAAVEEALANSIVEESTTSTTTTTTTTTVSLITDSPQVTIKYSFKDSPVLNWYDERQPYYYKRTDEEIEQLNEYHSQEGNERILSITDSAGNKILNNVKIFFGTKSDVLNKGVGHYITSADPSMYKGNASIAGYSKDEAYTPFEKLHTVSQGSKIRWTHVPSGTYWEYTVTLFFTAPNLETSVVRSVIPGPNANDATITLITEDINDSSKILVVRGLLTDGNETG